MASEVTVFHISHPAGADLSSNQYYPVALNGSGQLAIATAQGQKVVGVLRDKPSAAGIYGSVLHAGRGIVKAGAAFSLGDELTVNSSGKAITRTTEDEYCLGIAMEAATADDDEVSALILPGLGDTSLADGGADGRQKKGLVRFTYDFAVDGGAIGTITFAETLPDNAIVTRFFYDVITTLTSATDAATVAFGIATDDAAGLLAAVAISDAGNPFDAGYHDGIQDGAASNFAEKTTAERALIMVIAVEAVTAGKLVGFAEYVVSE